MSRILALDIGDKRIGVALSDPLGILASPLTIIERRVDEADVQAIVALIKQYDVQQIIAGLPVSLDGTEREQAEKVKSFIRKLQLITDVPLMYRDERFTTVTARQLMQETHTKKTRDKRRDDAFAAAVLLQGYLDEKKS